MTNLLQICQDGCNYIGVAAPTSIVGNTNDETAVRCLAAADAAGNSVFRRSPGGWVSMVREYDFFTKSMGPYDGEITSAEGASQCFIVIFGDATLFEDVTSTGWVMTGTYVPNNAMIVDASFAAGPDFWVFTLNIPATQVSSAAAGSYTLSQTDYPLPDDFSRAIDGTFWDRTRYWQMRGALSPQEWQGYRSSLYGKATIQRRWRFRNSDWLSSSAGTPATNVLSIDPIPVDNGSNLVFEYNSTGWCANANTGARQSRWLADTDYPVVDGYLVGLDFKWRLLRRFGLSYSEELSEYEREADKAVARDGSTAVLNLTPTWGVGLLTPLNIQDGNYPSRGT